MISDVDDLPTVLILAGGMGTRLHPLTLELPKSMILVNRKPFIEHQVKLMRDKGFREFVICVGNYSHKIRDFLKDGSQFGVRVRYSYEDKDNLLGTGGAIKNALSLVEENFCVLYGDSYLDEDLPRAFKKFLNSKKNGLMTVFKNNNSWDQSNVVFEKNEIQKYNKNLSQTDMKHIDYGFGAFTKKAFESFDSKKPFDLSVLYSNLLGADDLYGYEVFHRFYEIGSFTGIKQLEHYLNKR